MSPVDLHLLRLFKMKSKMGTIARLGSIAFASTNTEISTQDGQIRYADVFGQDLFKKETDMKLFVGMKVVTTSGAVGIIDSSFGLSGQCKIIFKAAGGVTAKLGERIFLQFKKYTHDPKKLMIQDDECFVLSPQTIAEAHEAFVPVKVKKSHTKKAAAAIAAAAAASSNSSSTKTQPSPSPAASSSPSLAAAAEPLPPPPTVESSAIKPPPSLSPPQQSPPKKASSSPKLQATAAPFQPPATFSMTSAGLANKKVTKIKVTKQPKSASTSASSSSSPIISGTVSSTPIASVAKAETIDICSNKKERSGSVVKIKEVDESKGMVMMIVEGLFTPEEDAKKFIGISVRASLSPNDHIDGTIVGAFGKGGKCKVNFPLESTVKENTPVTLLA